MQMCIVSLIPPNMGNLMIPVCYGLKISQREAHLVFWTGFNPAIFPSQNGSQNGSGQASVSSADLRPTTSILK